MTEIVNGNTQKIADNLVEIEAMAQELEAYIVKDAVYRTVVIFVADGNLNLQMSGGNLLARINQLEAQRGKLSPAQQEQLTTIEENVQRTIYSLRKRFHELLWTPLLACSG